jgi:hypothetical protein
LGCTWGEDKFVMVGGEGSIITSPDGIHWTNRESGIRDGSLRGVTSGKDRFIAVGDNNTILLSEDGIEWTAQQSPAAEEAHLYDVKWVNERFVAVGSPGLILTSRDGEQWEQQESKTTETLTGVAWDKGIYYVIGENATLLYSIAGTYWTPANTGIKGDFKAIISAAVPRGTYFLIAGETRNTGLLAKSDMAISEKSEVHTPNNMTWAYTGLTVLRGPNRRLNDIVWDRVQETAVGHDIVVDYATSWVYLNASLEHVGPLQCVTSNGKRVVAGGITGIITSSYSEGDWQERGTIWRGGEPIFLAESNERFSIPDTMINTDPVGHYGKLHTPKNDLLNFMLSNWYSVGFLAYPLLQVIAISLMRKRRVWKTAAMLPLVAMGCVFIFTALAFVGASNLWPIALIFAAPIAIAYLVILLSAYGIYTLYFKWRGTG